MKSYRLAVIGTGKSIGNHLRAISAVGERVELVAAVDLDEDRVREICQKYSIPRWYTSTTEMLAAVQPELVHIVTPPATHRNLVIECLEAGALVYCEKPLCASLAEFDQIAQAEARTDRYVSTVFQWRFGSAVDHVKNLICSGEAGKLLVGVCNTLWYRGQEYYNVPWRGHWQTEIGGPTMTLGIHLMDLFLWLMGEWREVQAMIGTLDRAIEVEDVSMALVRFENGAMGSVVNSALSPRQESYMRLDFQHLTVEVNALYRYANANWRFSVPDASPYADQLERWKAIETDIPGMHEAQLTQILDAMDHGEAPPMNGAEARRILEFTTSLYKSAFSRQIVERGSITPDDPFYYAMNGSPESMQRA